MNEHLVPIIVVPSLFAALGWVVYVIVDGVRRRQQLRSVAEFHGKLLDRIGSAREFGEFLNTSGGTRFLDALTIERGGGAPLRILRALQTGLVCVALGLGLFFLMSARNFSTEAQDTLATIATITLSLGTGLLLSAAASYRLSRRLGLLENDRDHREADAVRTA